MNDSQQVPEPFQYFRVRVPLLEFGKRNFVIAGSDLIRVQAQVIASGGETNVHSHGGNDALWLVLQGKARFNTIGNQVVVTIGKHEGIVIPSDTPYSFESASDGENLVIVRLGAAAQNVAPTRTEHSARKYAKVGATVIRPTKDIEGKFFGD